MPSPVIRAESLTKQYGSNRGVEDLSFEVEPGEVFGFLGPNGAGKTTTIRLLLDLLRPTSGRLEVLGRDPRRDGPEVRGRLGYIPGDLVLYPRLSGREHLRYFARLRRMDGLGDADRLARRLDVDLDRPVRALSKGNRQKIGLVQSLMHRPELLIVDEPTAGLDPIVQHVFYAVVDEATAAGRTVFLSSHVLSEVQRIAHRVALIRDGRLDVVETVDSLRARAFARVSATFATMPPPGCFDGLDGVRELERRQDTVVLALEGPADPLVKALARYEVVALDSHEADLEDVFLDLYEGSGADAR